MQEINAHEFFELLQEHPQATVVDVRFDYERAEHGYVAKSYNIPLYTPAWDLNPDFADAIMQLARSGEPMVFVCRSGTRSCEACEIAQSHGLTDIYNVRESHIDLVKAATQATAQGKTAPDFEYANKPPIS